MSPHRATLAGRRVLCGRRVRSGAAGSGAIGTSKVDAIFSDFKKPSSPGCSVGIYQDDRIVHQRAFGMANVDQDVALTR